MATPEQLEKALIAADAAGATDDAKVLAAELRRMRSVPAQAAEEPRQVDSPLRRFGGGIAETALGAVQFGAHLIPGLDTTGIDRQVEYFREGQAQGAPEGVDWARLGGNILATAPLGAVGGAPATVGQLVKTGGVVGAASGALQPTEGGDGYAGRKATQIGVGGVTGAIATPVASKVLGGLGSLGGEVVNQVRLLGPKPSQQQINVTITNTLQNAGLDQSQVRPEFMKLLQEDVKRALTLGDLDEEALANKAAAEIVGGPSLTRGQTLRDPTQWGQEDFLRQTEGGAALADQYRQAITRSAGRLEELQGAVAQATDNPTAGRRVIAPLQRGVDRGQNLVSSLYTIAKNQPGQGTPIDAAKVADDVYAQIQYDVSAPLPANIATALNDMAKGNLPLDVNAAQRLIKAANRAWLKADDDTRHSIGILKKNLDDALQALGGSSSGEAAAGYKAARSAAAQYNQKLDSLPALRAVADGEISPDTFIKKHVLGAEQKDLLTLKRYLMDADPAAWNQVRGQVLSGIRDAASKGNKDSISQDALGKQILSLKQSGKFNILFNEQERSVLEAVLRYARAVQSPPAGVRTTGLAGAARGTEMITRLIGQLGSFTQAAAPVVNVVTKRASQESASANALRGAPVGSNVLETVIPQRSANFLSRGLAIAAPTAIDE